MSSDPRLPSRIANDAASTSVLIACCPCVTAGGVRRRSKLEARGSEGRWRTAYDRPSAVAGSLQIMMFFHLRAWLASERDGSRPRRMHCMGWHQHWLIARRVPELLQMQEQGRRGDLVVAWAQRVGVGVLRKVGRPGQASCRSRRMMSLRQRASIEAAVMSGVSLPSASSGLRYSLRVKGLYCESICKIRC